MVVNDRGDNADEEGETEETTVDVGNDDEGGTGRDKFVLGGVNGGLPVFTVVLLDSCCNRTNLFKPSFAKVNSFSKACIVSPGISLVLTKLLLLRELRVLLLPVLELLLCASRYIREAVRGETKPLLPGL